MQIIDDPRERCHRLGTVAARIVQQDDAALAALILDPLHDHIGAGSRPILRIDALQHDGVAEFLLRDLERRNSAMRGRLESAL